MTSSMPRARGDRRCVRWPGPARSHGRFALALRLPSGAHGAAPLQHPGGADPSPQDASSRGARPGDPAHSGPASPPSSQGSLPASSTSSQGQAPAPQFSAHSARWLPGLRAAAERDGTVAGKGAHLGGSEPSFQSLPEPVRSPFGSALLGKSRARTEAREGGSRVPAQRLSSSGSPGSKGGIGGGKEHPEAAAAARPGLLPQQERRHLQVATCSARRAPVTARAARPAPTRPSPLLVGCARRAGGPGARTRPRPRLGCCLSLAARLSGQGSPALWPEGTGSIPGFASGEGAETRTHHRDPSGGLGIRRESLATRNDLLLFQRTVASQSSQANPEK